jgi:hypothetical protein
LPQKLLINAEAVADQQPTTLLVDGLPSDAFDIRYFDTDEPATFHGFGDQVYDLGHQECSKPPYLYGSYQIYKADRQN